MRSTGWGPSRSATWQRSAVISARQPLPRTRLALSLVLDAQLKVQGLNPANDSTSTSSASDPAEPPCLPDQILTEIHFPAPSQYGSPDRKTPKSELALDLPILGVAVLLSLDKGTVDLPRISSVRPPLISAVLHRLEEVMTLSAKKSESPWEWLRPTAIRAIKAETLFGERRSRTSDRKRWRHSSKEAQPGLRPGRRPGIAGDMIKVFVKRMMMKSMERILRPEEKVFPDTVGEPPCFWQPSDVAKEY